MPINEIIEGAVQNMADAIDRAKPDAAALRARLVERADQTLAALRDGKIDGAAWLTAADEDTVAFSPTTVDGHPVLMNGKTTTFWPKADAAAAIAEFRDAVHRGAFDQQLLSGGQPGISPKIEGEQTPLDPDNGSMTTGGGRTDADEVDTRFTEHLGPRTEPNGKR